MVETLFEAVANDDVDEAEEMIECGAGVDSADASGRTALMKACAAALPGLVAKLLELGASTSHRDCGGSDALLWACSCTDKDKEEATDMLEVVDALLDAGAPHDTADLAGTTALMRAAGLGKAELASRLLAHGASSEQTDGRGRNAVRHALAAGRCSDRPGGRPVDREGA